MPAQPRRRTASTTKKSTAAGEAAAREAVGDGDVVVEFRGEKFVVTRESRTSFRFAMASAGGETHVMMYELIAAKDRPRFIALGKPNEMFVDVAREFFAALNEASGEGNS